MADFAIRHFLALKLSHSVFLAAGYTLQFMCAVVLSTLEILVGHIHILRHGLGNHHTAFLYLDRLYSILPLLQATTTREEHRFARIFSPLAESCGTPYRLLWSGSLPSKQSSTNAECGIAVFFSRMQEKCSQRKRGTSFFVRRNLCKLYDTTDIWTFLCTNTAFLPLFPSFPKSLKVRLFGWNSNQNFSGPRKQSKVKKFKSWRNPNSTFANTACSLNNSWESGFFSELRLTVFFRYLPASEDDTCWLTRPWVFRIKRSQIVGLWETKLILP